MRPRVPWMSKVDDIVLEWLDDHDIAATPKVIHTNLDTAISYSQVNRRLWKLETNNLIERDPDRNDYYAITDLGRTYLHDPTATADDFPNHTDEHTDSNSA
ncbi:PadR family transcriptional regulator [Halobacterium sp. KA-6]|uniref:PadR family transcriptional regulator n=1 Tax=Halobacterium sp. KA-6 TaxID=2896368 RepID=UPI001E54EEEB|nr:PadR family transcriptional regulator [Halobacterium sp. KA-6]MCD2205073.1 PadR family transcriptional regulator [Halobacterium sp. KA-6]